MKVSIPQSVTLLISTYNWKEALSFTIESALQQTLLPSEIVIADDGSKNDTRDLVTHYQIKSPIPIKHVWHEDTGFRLTTIRNKAIAASAGEYIIQTDGDIILDKNFIKDHLEVARDGAFVCGSRVLLSRSYTEHIFKLGSFKFSLFKSAWQYGLNSLRSRLLRSFLASRYGQRKINRLRGCNMAFWRNDLMAVNGYNEDLTSWGHEDAELAYRLINAGKKKRFLKMGGVVYHLWHKPATKRNESTHYDAIYKVRKTGMYWCDNGLSKYLNNEPHKDKLDEY